MPKTLKYRRVLLKLSGEALGGESKQGFDMDAFDDAAMQIQLMRNEGVDTMAVVGGGNIARGEELQQLGMDRVTGDYLGMLATVQNALVLQSVLRARKVEARVMSALSMPPVCESYIRGRALRHIEKGRVDIFSAGTGNPLCTTDSAAALRAIEMSVDVVFAGKNGTRGVYDRDPNDPTQGKARFLAELSYDDAIKASLRVMDLGAMVLLRDHKVPTLVFDMKEPENIQRALYGERVGSLIHP